MVVGECFVMLKNHSTQNILQVNSISSHVPRSSWSSTKFNNGVQTPLRSWAM